MTTQADLSEGAAIPIRIAKIPYLIHAALILLVLNIVVLLWFYFSPLAPSSAKPVVADQNNSVQTHKESPFGALAAPKPRRAVKTPQRIEPVVPDVSRQYVPAFGSPAGDGK
jgi:hypothetical protein